MKLTFTINQKKLNSEGLQDEIKGSLKTPNDFKAKVNFYKNLLSNIKTKNHAKRN